MNYVAIGASLAMLAVASFIPPALANSDDIYFACWKQAEYVRGVPFARGGKEAWVANCVANATYDLEHGRSPRSNGQH